MLMYLISVKPFKEPRLNKVEIFNELTVLVCVWHFPLFSDYILDVDIRYMAGWSIVLITCTNLIINIGIVTYLSILEFKIRISKFCAKTKKNPIHTKDPINSKNTKSAK